MRVRSEEARDEPRVHAVDVAAFGRSEEATLVRALRAQVRDAISLVAEEEEVVGHILFTPVTLSGNPGLRIMGLAPMAVLPAHQRKGVGSALVRAGVDRCRAAGFDAIVVLGHPGYYPRFGFVPASRFGVDCEYDVIDDVFMMLALRPGALAGASGTIRYHAAFAQ